MTNPVSIRPAVPADALVLSGLAFRSKAYWEYSTEFMEAARVELTVAEEELKNQHCHHWIAESEDRVAGFCAVLQLSATQCQLDALFVEPEFIGKGIGTLLMEHAKADARRFGANALVIQSDPNAAPFYKAAGGVLVGETESGSIPGRFLPVYSIDLGSDQIN